MIRIALVAAGALALAGCDGPERSAARPLVVGAVLPLSGPAANAGEEILLGMRLAAETAVVPVEVRVLDGAGDPLASLRCARDFLAQSDVDAIVGGWSPVTARTLAAAIAGEEVPFLALSPRAAPARGTGGPHALHRLDALGAAAAGYCAEDLGALKAAVVTDPASEASRGLVRAFEEELAARGGAIVWTIDLDADRRPIRPAGRQPGIDAVFVAAPAAAVAAAAGFGVGVRDTPVVLVDGWDLAGADSLSTGREVRVVSFWVEDDPSAPARELALAFERIGVDGSPAAAFGWDAVRLLETVARAGDRDPAAVRAVLGSGLATFGATGRLAGVGAAGMTENPAISAVSGEGVSFLRRVDVLVGRSPGESAP